MIRNLIFICAALTYLLAATSPALDENDADLSGLWAFRCDDDQAFGSADPFPLEEFSAALFMMGSAVSGASSGETPIPWNGMVAGRFDGSGLDLEVLLIRSPMMVVKMTGNTTDSGAIAGTFVSSDETGAGWRGNFSASMTTPDTSLYEPAASEPLTFVPSVSGGISDYEEESMASPVEEGPAKRELQVISYSRDTIYARPVM